MSGFTERQLAAADGHRIVAHFFWPQGEPKAAVLIASAMGASQQYYAPFAAWLARQGFLTVTFDYRGTGLSRRGALRELHADILDWAQLDCAAAVDAAAVAACGRPLYWLGHSLGGQILPFVPNAQRVTKVVNIATGSGYWREISVPLRHIVWWLWYVIVPISLRLFGYFPGKRLRKIGDLPRGVMEQWRRWCLNREYAVGAEGERARRLYASLRVPVVSLSFTDDEYISARNTESLHGFLVNAPLKMKRLSPADIGVRRIGHFGFFRPAFETTLWRTELLPELS